MARLWIFSDLHQDWADNAWDPAACAPACDVIVVAGDAHSPLNKAIDWLADRLGGTQILYVPGNHDFWWDGGDDRYTMADQLARGRDLAARRGVTLLDNDSVTLGGVRFLGAHAVDRSAARHLVGDRRRALGAPRHERLPPRSEEAERTAQVRSPERYGRLASLQSRLARRSARAAARRTDRRRDTSRAAPIFSAGWLRPRPLLWERFVAPDPRQAAGLVGPRPRSQSGRFSARRVAHRLQRTRPRRRAVGV